MIMQRSSFLQAHFTHVLARNLPLLMQLCSHPGAEEVRRTSPASHFAACVRTSPEKLIQNISDTQALATPIYTDVISRARHISTISMHMVLAILPAAGPLWPLVLDVPAHFVVHYEQDAWSFRYKLPAGRRR
jgi:hypothetical protein